MAPGTYSALPGGAATSPKRKKYRKSIETKETSKMPHKKMHEKMPEKGTMKKGKMHG